MPFLKRQFPLLICFTVGIITALQFYIPSNFSQKIASQSSGWYIIITVFASFLGYGSVAMVHYKKIKQQHKGWGYSTLVFIGVFLMVLVGLIAGGKEITERPPDELGTPLAAVETKDAQGNVIKRVETTVRTQKDKTKEPSKVLVLETELAPDGKVLKATETKYDRKGNVLDTRIREIDKDGRLVAVEGNQTGFGWLYTSTLVPLQGTMFALLGFYIASAAFRSFRAKSFEAGLLLATAMIVLIGNVPFSNYIWANGLGIHEFHGIRLETTDIVTWIMQTPNTAARRGVGFGVALGVIATSLKIIFGIERAYLGGGD
jgi:hypothetical protein